MSIAPQLKIGSEHSNADRLYDAASRSRKSPTAPVWTEVAALALSLSFLLYTFIGIVSFGGLSPEARTAGSPPDRVVVLAMTAVAILIMAHYRHAVLDCLRSNALIFGVIGICQLSLIWSDHPELTIRRATLLALTAVIAMAVAVSIKSLRSFHSLLFLILFLVILVNLASVVLWPALAISDIGVQGIYGQKNIAGMIAAIALIVGVTWVAGSTSPRQILVGSIAVAVIAFFLALTSSKTSVGIAAAALAVGSLFWLASKAGYRFVLAIFCAAMLGIAALLVLVAANDFDLSRVLGLFVSDTSFTGRDELWEFAWRKASERLWLGHGYGAFWDVGVLDDPLAKLEPGTWLGDVATGIINQAHNGYLELWLHIGLPATGVAVAAIIASMVSATRLATDAAAAANTRSTYAAIALIMLMYLLHNLTEATLFMRGNQFFAIVLLMTFIGSEARRRCSQP
jgi:exopolysaccharide production protein ExoQ